MSERNRIERDGALSSQNRNRQSAPTRHVDLEGIARREDVSPDASPIDIR